MFNFKQRQHKKIYFCNKLSADEFKKPRQGIRYIGHDTPKHGKQKLTKYFR